MVLFEMAFVVVVVVVDVVLEPAVFVTAWEIVFICWDPVTEALPVPAIPRSEVIDMSMARV